MFSGKGSESPTHQKYLIPFILTPNIEERERDEGEDSANSSSADSKCLLHPLFSVADNLPSQFLGSESRKKCWTSNYQFVFYDLFFPRHVLLTLMIFLKTD